jgi:hypothetical protein
VAGFVGGLARLGEKGLPFAPGQAVVVPVGAGVLAPMVEEADVVVFHLQRLDARLDEII